MINLELEEEKVRIKKLQEISRYMYMYIGFYLTMTVIMAVLDTFKRYYILSEHEEADSLHLTLTLSYL
jgi:hypothetical protein